MNRSKKEAQMDRRTWRKEKRRLAEARYDTLHSPTYDEDWGVTISATHERFLHHFLALCPLQALILDAACGTGKYWPMILDSGRKIVGIDQSQGMLNRARAKFPEMPIKKVGLQEMDYRSAFDGAICVDAMEFVFPEDWPLVLDNFRQALKPGSYLYLTVEMADEHEIERDFAAGQRLGLPLVYGESADENGYHYYPEIEQVEIWLALAHLRLIDKATGDEYHHFLVQKGNRES
jgi:SAM-dependent methyltransferase